MICGALRIVLAKLNVGKAKSPILDFLGFSSKFKIVSCSKAGTIAAISFAINLL